MIQLEIDLHNSQNIHKIILNRGKWVSSLPFEHRFNGFVTIDEDTFEARFQNKRDYNITMGLTLEFIKNYSCINEQLFIPGRTYKIVYKVYNKITERTIDVKEYDGRIVEGYCHLRKADRKFNINKIIKRTKMESGMIYNVRGLQENIFVSNSRPSKIKYSLNKGSENAVQQILGQLLTNNQRDYITTYNNMENEFSYRLSRYDVDLILEHPVKLKKSIKKLTKIANKNADIILAFYINLYNFISSKEDCTRKTLSLQVVISKLNKYSDKSENHSWIFKSLTNETLYRSKKMCILYNQRSKRLTLEMNSNVYSVPLRYSSKIGTCIVKEK